MKLQINVLVSQLKENFRQNIIFKHANAELTCLNKTCVKLIEFAVFNKLKYGEHITHMKDQRNLKELIEYFNYIEKECETLISELSLMVGKINKLFIYLIKLRMKKNQFSKERLLQLDAKQLNQALDLVINYDKNKICLFEDVRKFLDDMIIKLSQHITEFKLQQNQQIIQNGIHQPQKNDIIFQLNIQELKQVEELYQQGYNLRIQDPNSIIYCNHKKYDEAIKLLNQALNFIQKHQLLLWCKTSSLIYQNENY